MQTRISTKGQIVLPKEIRMHRKWETGMLLKVEETAEGVLLKPLASLPDEEAFLNVKGCLSRKGQPTKSLEEMDMGIASIVSREGL
jgi:AbrB family looped-hinge helix DNA binding protein